MPLLDVVVAALQLGVARYMSDDSKPELRSDDLVDELDLSDDDAAKVSQLLLREGWFFAGGWGEASSEWGRELRPDIRDLRGMRSVDDLLEALRRRRSPSLPKIPSSAGVEDDPHPPSPPLGPTPLFSERRRGRGRALTPSALARLFLSLLADFKRQGFYDEAFYDGERAPIEGEPSRPPKVTDPTNWLTSRLGRADLWQDLLDPQAALEVFDKGLVSSPWEDPELVFDVLELWHGEIVSEPVEDEDGAWEGYYGREAGRRAFREAVNAVLVRCDPPMEIRDNSRVVELSAAGLTELVDHPLPSSREPADVESKVDAAVQAFRARGASREDQIGAITRLAGILERMREDGRLREAGLTRRDEGALFNIANNYGLRHDNAAQRDDYGAAHREWIFHTYLAGIRLASRTTSPPYTT